MYTAPWPWPKRIRGAETQTGSRGQREMVTQRGCVKNLLYNSRMNTPAI